MANTTVPTYAVFDDYRYSQRIAVSVRWFLIVVWVVLHNYAPTINTEYFALSALVLGLATVNAYVHWRIRQGRPVTWGYVVALSGMDLVFITVGVGVTGAFNNTFFVLYYPALLGMSLVASSWRLSFPVVTVVSIAYIWMSLAIGEGVDFSDRDEKKLGIRLATMFAVVAAGNLMIGIERERRREAVEAERARAEENLELQKKAQEAERAAELAEANERLREELDERQRAEQALKRRTDELGAVNKELETFSYSVSHDLRSPLRSINGFSQALLEDYGDKLDDEGKGFLARVRAASQRMGQLIDDLLNMSRVTRGEAHFETVDVSALARSIVAELQQNEPERQVAVVIADGLEAEGDAQLLRVALGNLIGNSWKYTGKQQQANIEVGVAEHDHELAYFVRDDGVGFDMAYADKLFGAFQRLHSAGEFDGSGIGLATVQRVIHRHGGRVWAESEVGQGATFYFTLG